MPAVERREYELSSTNLSSPASSRMETNQTLQTIGQERLLLDHDRHHQQQEHQDDGDEEESTTDNNESSFTSTLLVS